MPIKIALAGNPNSGKTTMFNALTGSAQRVGNWPGVTVEKKEGRLKHEKNIFIQDLPGIYSLSPYTLEEIVARNYLIDERPDAIVNIVDASNIERNLFLTTQLLELGIPVVIALNMIDVVRKNGTHINIGLLSEILGCRIVETSALKKIGCNRVVEEAISISSKKGSPPELKLIKFSKNIEAAIFGISEILKGKYVSNNLRWYSIKVFERDPEVLKNLSLSFEDKETTEEMITACEVAHHGAENSETLIIRERYRFISGIIGQCVTNTAVSDIMLSDKIDKVVTNRFLALPIFAVVMFFVYYFSITTIGTMMTNIVNDGVFGEGFHLNGSAEYEQAQEEYRKAVSEFHIGHQIETDTNRISRPDPGNYGLWIPGLPILMDDWLKELNVSKWLHGLIVNGILAGVGAVLGFLPQMLVLFLCLALLEDCGYMARIAFIMDRIFRKIGLSGKSFIPILIGTGCGVPGIMASRTIENEDDRRMTVITTTFMPCSAKLPLIALIAGALFNDAGWVAASAYFMGIVAIMISGLLLKKTKLFTAKSHSFVMELPDYHVPILGSALKCMWQRGYSFIKKAGTIVLVSTTVIWFLSNFNWSADMVDSNSTDSILSHIGVFISPLFAPLGWGDWKSAVASISGLVAKENIVGTFGVLFGFGDVSEEGMEYWEQLRTYFTPLSAYSFLIFNLLCAPCFAAIGAVRREMMSVKWTWFAILYQTGFAYSASLVFYQGGMFLKHGTFNIWTGISTIPVCMLCCALLKRTKHG